MKNGINIRRDFQVLVSSEVFLVGRDTDGSTNVTSLLTVAWWNYVTVGQKLCDTRRKPRVRASDNTNNSYLATDQTPKRP